MVRRWEWRLANGARIAATLDASTGAETVLEAQRVASTCGRGEKPEGHTVHAAPDGLHEEVVSAVVTFDPRAAICILRVDGFEVAPVVWPTRAATAPPVEPRNLAGVLPVGLLVLGLVGGSLWMLARRGGETDVAPLEKKHRAANGLFVAHFPQSFATTLAVMPPGSSGIALEDRATGGAVVLVASRDLGSSDPWQLHQRLHGEALANVPKHGGTFEELSRADAACMPAQKGAMVVGRVMAPGGERTKVWSCAFVHDGAAYLAMTALPDPPPSSASEKELRAVVVATELTQLSEIAEDPSATTH